MNLHTPTLLIAMTLGFGVLTLELGASLRALRARRELLGCALACWVLLAGLAGLALRPPWPAWVVDAGSNALIAIGIALYAQALHRLLGQATLPRWMLAAQGLVLLGTVAMAGWPAPWRNAALSCAFAGLLWPCATLIMRRGWHAERSLRSLAVTLLLAMAALCMRAVQAAIAALEGSAAADPSTDPGLGFLLASLAVLGLGFGFALVVFERVAGQLEEMATHDGLTGCLNRSTTDAMLTHELQRNRRQRTPLAFVLLDLDHFKRVNDLHGHRTGDAVLRQFVRTVRERLRDSDVLGRTGGEEFGLVLPGTDAAGAQRLVEDIRQAVQASRVISERGQTVKVTVSAGVVVAAPDVEVAPEHLYGQADKALYAAKRSGRNRATLYRSEGASAPVAQPSCQ